MINTSIGRSRNCVKNWDLSVANASRSLGLTYKPNTDTLRRSLAIELCRLLQTEGVEIRAFDPVVKALPDNLQNVNLFRNIEEATPGSDAVVVCYRVATASGGQIGPQSCSVAPPGNRDRRERISSFQSAGDSWCQISVRGQTSRRHETKKPCDGRHRREPGAGKCDCACVCQRRCPRCLMCP